MSNSLMSKSVSFPDFWLYSHFYLSLTHIKHMEADLPPLSSVSRFTPVRLELNLLAEDWESIRGLGI